MSTSNTVIKCRKCRVAPIFFTEERGSNGLKIPYEVSTKSVHNCMFSDSWDCGFCGDKLYFDYTRRTSETGRRIPLNYYTSDPHICSKR